MAFSQQSRASAAACSQGSVRNSRVDVYRGVIATFAIETRAALCNK
jgi:hypothetical protein